METNCPTRHRGRILLVDDNPSDLKYIVRLLLERDYTPHVAMQAESAMAFLRDTVPDLILLDVNLPGQDGYALCRTLKADPRLCDVPVIFVSADTDVLDRVEAFSAGAVDYICKPFQEAEALARIETHIALRRLTSSLVEAKERAERASLAKSQFLANMSHELRTPLNAVLGYAQLLQLGGSNLDDKQRRGVDSIYEAGQHLLRLIDDILDLARIEAGKVELSPTTSSLSSMLRFVTHTISVRADSKGLPFECDAPPDLPALMVDERRLSQVLLNLLGNAVKFTQQGHVALSVRLLPDGDTSAARLRFTVEDTGPGISAADLGTIFRPFEQLGAAEQRAGGTGLGLAISRHIVQLMGSDILVQSEPGCGSRFWFDLRLPFARLGTAPKKDTQTSTLGYDGPRKTVLVVDDVQANRDIAAGVLSLIGFRVIEAHDGRDALEKVRAHKPDLVIMDLLMPTMNGLDAMHFLRKTADFASLPIVAVSASSYPADEQRAMDAGATAFLAKPLDFNRLFKQMDSLLRLNLTADAHEPEDCACAA